MTQLFTLNEAMPVLTWLKRNTPLIHCLTNTVSMNFVANTLLAVGASPSMVAAWQEIGDFTLVADNLMVNVGSLTDARLRGISMGVQTAHENGKPWVLDPAAVSDKLSYRSSFARELLRYYPAVIRGNAAEILYLAGEKSRNRGADSLNDSNEAIGAAQMLAQRQNAIVVVSDESDYIVQSSKTQPNPKQIKE
ncbi:hydroxyethylthiazole kinase [Suttonella ornithocola]|uniref:hydroxyethylthiazole kinase n=1 Tax=Suttonella ornithocola TaxID=279832 RepID=A0A380MUV2_9GAMM|nr:hydroxyethylthiazole kinase [Suttonella ornithocola]SUO95826.1 Hydroxyethylthiazole kinase [Suttonella ornithocola]